MHTSSLQHVQGLVHQYLSERTHEHLRIVDIGSYDVNGSYKQFFLHRAWTYVGVDLSAGPNVDVVLETSYRLPFASHSVDLIVSGQAFEHVEYFWCLWLEMVRVLRPGGLIFLLAPSRGPEHRYPQDCWRFYPDGYRALAKFGGVELLQVSTDWEGHPAEDSHPWGDTVGVFRQPDLGVLERVKRRLGQRIRYWTMPGYV